MRWTLFVTIGCLLILLGASERSKWLSPGPLNQAHGRIDQCAGCHSDFDRGLAAWLVAAGGAHTETGSVRCTECHRMGDDALFAHSKNPKTLQQLSDKTETHSSSPMLSLRLFPGNAQEKIACASCHIEHRGAGADLTRIDDIRCQDCHQNQFVSFTSGHPEFERYPADRRTHLIFDHARHFNRHFAESKKAPPEDCAACHMPDLRGERMGVRAFDISCSKCHQGQIDGSDRAAGNRAIPVLSAFGLDLDSLENAGFSVGQWPDFSDTEVTPMMWLLLATDPELRRDLATMRRIPDVLDLSSASDSELRAVQNVAWGTKKLLHKLSIEGTENLVARLENTIGNSLSHHKLSALVAALPLDTVDSARDQWFPGLQTEMINHEAGVAPPLTAQPTPAPQEPVPEPLIDDSDDLLLDDDLLTDDDLLGGDDLLADDEIWDGADEIFDESAGGTAIGATIVEIESVSPEQWAAVGGWYREDFTLFYRPVGHDDQFLRAWLDVLGFGQATAVAKLTEPIFMSLVDPLAPGACAKCHSIDRVDEALVINWQPTRSKIAKSFNRFSHTTHFSLSAGEACNRCHTLKKGADVLSSFKKYDPTDFASGFADIPKKLCAECHTSTQAGEACIQCHTYHVGKPEPVLPATRIEASVAGR